MAVRGLFVLFLVFVLDSAAVPSACHAAQDLLDPIIVSQDTADKPQSKLWWHEGRWWAVLPSRAVSPSGTWLWRLEDNASWTNVLYLSAAIDTRADVLAVGAVAHVLLYGSAPELISIEHHAPQWWSRLFSGAKGTYQPWSDRAASTLLALPGSETATIDIDSTGRLWLATDSETSVHVYYADAPYSSFSGPITLATEILTDDISAIKALPNGTVGVLWSNQNENRFGFRVHEDGTDPATWLDDEVPASQSARKGMADDHINLAVASDGTLYAAVKTSYDEMGLPMIALLVRRPNGSWDQLYSVDKMGRDNRPTRPVVVVNEKSGLLHVVYTRSEAFSDIVAKASKLDSIDFGVRSTLIKGGLNNATSTKQNWTDRVVILASDSSTVLGLLTDFQGSRGAAP